MRPNSTPATTRPLTTWAGAMNTNHLIESYLLSRRARGSSRSSIANTRWALDSFSRHIGRRPLGNVGSVDLENWLEACADYAPASRRAMLSAVRCFLGWAERRKYVRRNPANDIRGPRQPRTLPRALTSGAPARILAACPDARARFIVTAMLQQGLRCVEVSRLVQRSLRGGRATYIIMLRYNAAEEKVPVAVAVACSVRAT